MYLQDILSLKIHHTIFCHLRYTLRYTILPMYLQAIIQIEIHHIGKTDLVCWCVRYAERMCSLECVLYTCERYANRLGLLVCKIRRENVFFRMCSLYM